jgi:MFS family permease
MPGQRSLFSPAFLLVCGITFLTFFSAFQLFPTVPLRLLEMGARREQTGLFMSLFTGGSALGALFTGPLGDRVGQRRMMIVAAMGFAICIGLYGFIDRSWWLFPVLALPHGIVWSGLLTTTMPILGEVLSEEQRAAGISLYGLASPAGVFLGPAMGMIFWRRFGFAPLSQTLAVLFLIIAALAFGLPRDRAERGLHPHFQAPSGVMMTPCIVLFATALGYGSLSTFTAQEILKLGGDKPWIFLPSMAAGMITLRILVSFTGFGRRPLRWLPIMLWTTFAGLAILAFLPGGTVRHALAALLYGGGYSMMYTLVTLYVLDRVEAHRRGAAFGAMLFSFDSGIGLGAFLIGQIIGRSEPSLGALAFRLGWSAAALASFIAVLMGYRLMKEARKTGMA